jgi:hypothetical protein
MKGPEDNPCISMQLKSPSDHQKTSPTTSYIKGVFRLPAAAARKNIPLVADQHDMYVSKK